MPGKFSPTPRVSDPDMHHGTCVTRVSWCMPGSLTAVSYEVSGGENLPGIPSACATANFTNLVRGPMVVSIRSSCHVADLLLFLPTDIGNSGNINYTERNVSPFHKYVDMKLNKPGTVVVSPAGSAIGCSKGNPCDITWKVDVQNVSLCFQYILLRKSIYA